MIRHDDGRVEYEDGDDCPAIMEVVLDDLRVAVRCEQMLGAAAHDEDQHEGYVIHEGGKVTVTWSVRPGDVAWDNDWAWIPYQEARPERTEESA